MKFEKHYVDRLFLSENQTGDRGFLAFVIPPGTTPPDKDAVSLQEALTNPSYVGSFVFGAKSPAISDRQSAEHFIASIYRIVPASTRQFIWLTDPANITANTVYPAQISGDGTSFQTGLAATLTASLIFQIQSGMQISLDGDGSTLRFDGGSNAYQLQFSGNNAPQMRQVTAGRLPFSGSLRGCVQFTGYIQRTSLLENLQAGFQCLIPDADNPDALPLSEWLPFVDPTDSPSDYIGFNISIDPSDPCNDAFDPCGGGHCLMAAAYDSRRTFFNFTGKNFEQLDIRLASFYRSPYGANVILTPGTAANADYNARLVIALGSRASSMSADDFYLCPEGDFLLSLPATTETYNQRLCCGLSGTEFFNISPQTDSQKGDILRFISRRPAYISGFPFPVASPVGPPTNPTASPFDPRYQTSWATLVANSGKQITYVSQPKGTAFFGKDKLIAPTYTDLFGHTTASFQFTANDIDFFPMFPYAGLQAKQNSILVDDVQNLEKTVISPQRRIIVSKLSPATGIATGESKYDATPSGVIVKTTQSTDGGAVKWDEVRLGWNQDNGKRYDMAFEDPPDPLVNALQSSDVFLVVANQKNIGNFRNSMGLGSWEMQANIGIKQKYGDYRNVMIFKGRKGKLYDPDDPANSLVANPKKWTQPQDFSVPTTTDAQGGQDGVDESQLVILSQWLQTYFNNAHQQAGDPYFDKFNQIAQMDSWTGVLFLRIDVQSLPENLKGILAGITTPEAFNAHHLGIDISPLKKNADGQPAVEQPSSVFGLIYYVDPNFSDTLPLKSIAPTNSDPYNFRLLSLKVLFENTAVKSFESYAQLTLNQLFGATVTKMGNPDNIYQNVLLAGSLQINNGKVVYSLSSLNDDAFYFDSNIINKVEITGLLLSTRSGDNAANVVSWFGMIGFIDFCQLTDPQNQDSQAFDIFSFGNDLGQDKPRQGLSFSNLGIQMSFPAADPTSNTLAFSASEIAFDLSRSTPRKNSLYLNLILDLDALVTGTKEKGPKDSGYLDVIPDLRLGGVAGGDWYGLRFKLNMGTPGELAGKVNLDSYLLLSWSPDSSSKSGYKAGVGIELPGTSGGAKLISLQNVMKLSIGQIRLTYVKVQGTKDQYSFLLLFTDIALKFLGLLKIPPNGNTLFYLFGNPNAGGKASGLGWYAMYAQKDKSRTLVEF